MMDVIDLAAEAGIKAEYDRNEARIRGWRGHAVLGAAVSVMATVLWWVQTTPHWGSATWMFCVIGYVYFGLTGALTLWFLVDHYIYKFALKRSQNPYQHSIFLPRDVAETKAHGKCSCELDQWERRVLRWASDNVGKSAMRKGKGGYRFYFKEFEDYALFKLWV